MKLAILHYLPLEYYPPITNLIDYIAKELNLNFGLVKVFSTHNIKGRIEYRVSSISKENNYLKINHKLQITNYKLPTIHRSSFPKETDSSPIRLLKYIQYNLFTLIGLVIFRPNNLLYYESYSVWPAYIYTRYFNKKCSIFIHNHEYADKEWYATTMRLVRYYHILEKKWLYPQAIWNSQTNDDRLRLFHNDHPTIKPETLKVMPNYPPRCWQRKNSIPNQPDKYTTENPLKIVYVGSLSFQSTYLKEFCDWVIQQKGETQFDIYSYNLYNDVKEYFYQLSPFINYFNKGVEYYDLPHILSQYQVGLILYKAHNKNYTFNAPNKLFEYLACNLDVWYHKTLHGPQPYNTNETYPKVMPIDFDNLNSFDIEKAIDKSNCRYKPNTYWCENAIQPLIKELIK